MKHCRMGRMLKGNISLPDIYCRELSQKTAFWKTVQSIPLKMLHLTKNNTQLPRNKSECVLRNSVSATRCVCVCGQTLTPIHRLALPLRREWKDDGRGGLTGS